MTTALSIIKEWFNTGKKPTANQFSDTFDSFWHKWESIPQETVARDPLQDIGIFSFTLKQTKNSTPEMTVLRNDFRYDPMWLYAYEGKGDYVIRSDNENSTWAGTAYYSASQPREDDTTVRIKQYNDYGFRIMTYKSGDLSDDLLDDSVLFEIRMQPGTYGGDDAK